jgi:hypothetical protein
MSTMHPYRAHREQGRSPEELAALFAPDVVFNSPIFRRPVEGRELVLEVMKNSVQVRDGKYTAEFRSGTHTVLIWSGTIEGMPLQSFEMLEDGPDGLVRSRTVAMRSYPALTAFRESMKPRLQHIVPADFW